ncbi:MAG: hypothetical protein M3Q99_10850 [Acidobacteriota bacterium]|nr:hypothetical protein [Acidobacteriota bacterium]
MKINVSLKLQNFVWEIKRNGKISAKEILMLESIISSEKKWMINVGYFMDILFLLGIFLFTRTIFSMFEIQEKYLLEFIIGGTIYGIHKIFWYSSNIYSLYKGFNSDGVKCSEVESLSNAISNIYLKQPLLNFLRISNFLYSPKTQKEIFDPIAADWQTEYFEALFKKEIYKARWINVRYTYAFIIAIWQKSPIGDLIEFIRKIAK